MYVVYVVCCDIYVFSSWYCSVDLLSLGHSVFVVIRWIVSCLFAWCVVFCVDLICFLYAVQLPLIYPLPLLRSFCCSIVCWSFICYGFDVCMSIFFFVVHDLWLYLPCRGVLVLDFFFIFLLWVPPRALLFSSTPLSSSLFCDRF